MQKHDNYKKLIQEIKEMEQEEKNVKLTAPELQAAEDCFRETNSKSSLMDYDDDTLLTYKKCTEYFRFNDINAKILKNLRSNFETLRFKDM